METKDLVLFVLATYGAVLSTVTVGLTFLRNRRKLRVTCTVAYYMDVTRFDPYVQIVAVNLGRRPVTVTSIGWTVPNGKYMLASPSVDDVQARTNTPLPATLSDGESAKMMVSLAKLKAGLREANLKGDVALLPQVGDSAGSTHEGKAFILDPDSE